MSAQGDDGWFGWNFPSRDSTVGADTYQTVSCLAGKILFLEPPRLRRMKGLFLNQSAINNQLRYFDWLPNGALNLWN